MLQADLDKALPALDEAVASLKSLSKNDVVEVKSMSNPPAGVKMVMDACCIMFDLKGKKIPDPNGAPGAPKITDYWDDAKKLLNDPSKFLNSLMTYDKDNIPQVRPAMACVPCAPKDTQPACMYAVTTLNSWHDPLHVTACHFALH